MLHAGDTLLHYRVVERIGEGGMGVVWRATDTRLGRDVAIKLLPESVTADDRRLVRFEREARALAALKHPNIVTIYAVEQTGETWLLVMEYVDGTPLSAQIPDRGLPLGRLLELVIAVSDAVAEAHRHGVAHRDLKPDNIVVGADGRPRVLDFGLAKLIDVGSAGADSFDGTVTRGPGQTVAGEWLGTPAYMSPEQAEGRPADARSDVFALGVVLYEMATGQRPFRADNPARLVTSILTERPRSLAELRPDLPAAFGRIVEHCLDKDPDRRFQTAGELHDRLVALHDGPRPAHRARRAASSLAIVAAAAAVVAALWFGLARDRTAPAPAAPAPPTAHVLSQLTFDPATEQWAAFSPDGNALVYAKETAGFSKLFLRDVATGRTRQLTAGDRDDIQPAWSPDGAIVVFVRASNERGKLEPSEALAGVYDDGALWAVDVSDGRETLVVDDAFNPAFSPDGSRIAVDASWAGPRRIWTTDARGRNPQQVTTGESEAVQHTQPAWSPDGARIVFQQGEKTKLDLRAVDATGGESIAVTDDLYSDLDPVWSADGGHIYFSSYRGGGLNIWRVPVAADGRPVGAPQQLTTGAGQDIQASLAPDGDRLVFTVLSQNADLWRLPVDPGTGAVTGEAEPIVVSTREDSRGAWSPDGRRLAFNSDRDGTMNVWIHSLADGATERLTSGPGGDYQPRWSHDGRSIAFFSARSANAEIWLVDVETRVIRQLTDHPALDTNPFFSPDDRSIAFQSDRDGRKEVWLVAVDGGEPRRLSTVGAADHFMRWSDDGRLVYFRSSARPENGICRVPVSGGEADCLGVPLGWHMSFSPDRTRVMDVVGHKGLWVYPIDGGSGVEVHRSAEPDVRVDYPEWSPDGRWVVYDRVVPRGGDVWLLDGLTAGGPRAR
ncbi:MAG TPA: protein kinase [Candidatus Polarisedimenticolaceae bacterium]|nr:protein kinase [Candidatus Polarisedimenticolaceae bacterium]